MIVLRFSMQEGDIFEHTHANCHVCYTNGQLVDHWCNVGISLIVG